MGIVVAATIVVLPDWAEPTAGDAPAIALITNNHSPLQAEMTVDDPSIDFFPDLSDTSHPALQGVVRTNVLAIRENDGNARMGVVLPVRSSFLIGGAFTEGLGVQNKTVIKKKLRGEMWPTCDPNMVQKGYQDARNMVEVFNQDLRWTVECRRWGTVIWQDLPKRVTTAAYLDYDAQRIMSSGSGQVLFRIPDYKGIRRTAFSAWTVDATVESGRILPGLTTGNVATLFGGAASPAVAFHDEGGQRIVSAYPSGFNLEKRLYLRDSARTWHIGLTGKVYEFTTQMERKDYAWWDGALRLAAPLVLSVYLTAIIAWAWRRVRSSRSQ